MTAKKDLRVTMDLEKVLVVEDDEDIQKIVSTVLSAKGIEVYACTDGRKAMNSILEFTPDLILLDEVMPYVRGTKIIKALKQDENTKDIAVVFFTGKSYDEHVDEYMSLGASAVLQKPFDPLMIHTNLERVYKGELRGMIE